MANERQEDGCYVALTHDHLDAKAMMDRVRSPKAGAIVLFAGTTRDNFAGKPVKELQYTSYEPRALQTMLAICKVVLEKYSLTAISMIHRLGVVPIGEESILIAVSSPHRQAAWRAGEEALEECKERVEVGKGRSLVGMKEVYGEQIEMVLWAFVSTKAKAKTKTQTSAKIVLQQQDPTARSSGKKYLKNEVMVQLYI